ncbi:HigA family addiction module antitoxin [Brucellaceae bacterium D45D]
MLAIHPGKILKGELEARQMSATVFARALRLPSSRIVHILNGELGISADTAERLARYFGNSAQFWLSLQITYESRKDLI